MTAPGIKKIITGFAVVFIAVVLIGVAIRGVLGLAFPVTQDAVSSSPHPVNKGAGGLPVTEINLLLSIPLDSLRQAVEKYAPLTYNDVDDDPTDFLVDDRLTYALKRGPIKMGLAGNTIGFSFPVSGTVAVEGKVNLGVVKIDTSAHGDVEGIISGEIAVKILPDWRLEPDIQFKIKILKASIPIKRFGEISLRTILEQKLTDKIKRKRKKLNAKVMDKNSVREKVTEIWEKMHQVKQLKENPGIWATVVPLTVGFMSVTGSQKDGLQTGIKLTLTTRLFIRETAPSVAITKLPDADILTKIPGTFKLRLPFQIEAATLNRYIAKEIIGYPREVAKNIFVTAKRADIVSSGHNKLSAILFANVEQKRLGLMTDCRFYINGAMVHDPVQNIIRITNIDYDATFSRWWVSTLNWVMYPYLVSRLEKQWVFPIGKALDKAHGKLTDEIEKLVVPQGIKATVSVNPPTLSSLVGNRQGFSGVLVLDGILGAALDFPMK